MIFTSYFANLKNLPDNVIPVSICGKAPDWYEGLQYKKLAPTYDLFMEWKDTHNNARYTERFKTEVLNNRNIVNVLNDLQVLLPDEIKARMWVPVYVNPHWHIALICYEKPCAFCHRHLVAEWLLDNKIECVEFYPEVKGVIKIERPS